MFVSISVSGDNAFAKSGTVNYPVEVENSICSLSATTPPTFTVVVFSSSVNVGMTPAPAIGDKCAADLGVLFAGLNIKDVHSIPPKVVCDPAGKRYWDQQHQ